MIAPTKAPQSRRRRLQRDKDFTGDRLTSFRDVFLRHGLPGLTLGLLFLTVPTFQRVFADALTAASAHPGRYAAGALLILLALNAYAWRIDRDWSLAKLGWVLYLGALSVWEEWVFRLAVPQGLETAGASVWTAALISAVLFGALHYFTLRWKWCWCVGAALGGIYFSVQIERHNDLLLVAAIHWVATYLNTPRLPGASSGTKGEG
ncbi:MAG: CPBP family intramembrane glutamic endopeptidase [Pseudomonadota bacterium]